MVGFSQCLTGTGRRRTRLEWIVALARGAVAEDAVGDAGISEHIHDVHLHPASGTQQRVDYG